MLFIKVRNMFLMFLYSTKSVFLTSNVRDIGGSVAEW